MRVNAILLEPNQISARFYQMAINIAIRNYTQCLPDIEFLQQLKLAHATDQAMLRDIQDLLGIRNVIIQEQLIRTVH